jgi:hypothetical protein
VFNFNVFAKTTKLILLDSLLQEIGDGSLRAPPLLEVGQEAVPDRHIMQKNGEKNGRVSGEQLSS